MKKYILSAVTLMAISVLSGCAGTTNKLSLKQVSELYSSLVEKYKDADTAKYASAIHQVDNEGNKDFTTLNETKYYYTDECFIDDSFEYKFIYYTTSGIFIRNEPGYYAGLMRTYEGFDSLRDKFDFLMKDWTKNIIEKEFAYCSLDPKFEEFENITKQEYKSVNEDSLEVYLEGSKKVAEAEYKKCTLKIKITDGYLDYYEDNFNKIIIDYNYKFQKPNIEGYRIYEYLDSAPAMEKLNSLLNNGLSYPDYYFKTVDYNQSSTANYKAPTREDIDNVNLRSTTYRNDRTHPKCVKYIKDNIYFEFLYTTKEYISKPIPSGVTGEEYWKDMFDESEEIIRIANLAEITDARLYDETSIAIIGEHEDPSETRRSFVRILGNFIDSYSERIYRARNDHINIKRDFHIKEEPFPFEYPDLSKFTKVDHF